METVQFQSYVFSYSVYGGVLIGILYDIYRVLRGRRRNELLITSLWDVLFLLSVFGVVVWAVFSSSYGDIRGYVFIGFVVGFYLYEKLLGRIAAGLFYFLIRTVSGFLKKTNNILVLPIKLVCSFLHRCYCSIAGMFRRVKGRLRKVRRLPKQVIYDSRKYYGLIVKKRRKRNRGN